MGLVPKYYYLLAADTSQVSIYFSLSKIKLINIDFLSSKLSLTYRLMITITKVFTLLSTLPVWEQRIPWQLSKQTGKLFFQTSAKYILFLTKLKGDGRLFWNGKAYTFPMNHLLHVGVMLTFIKVFIILFLLVRIGNTLSQNKSVSSAFN